MCFLINLFGLLVQMIERHLGFSGSPLSAHVAANIRVPTQIKELEAAFDAHKREVETIREEFKKEREKAGLLEVEVNKIKTELTEAKSELEKKTEEMAALDFEKRRYFSMLTACNGFEPSLDDEEDEGEKGKIVHFKENPADIAHRDWLTDEAISLEQQRRAERNGSDHRVDAMTSAECEDLRRRIDALERALERKEKDLKATREMAAFSIKELQ